MKNLNETNIIQQLRDRLKPLGRDPVIRLDLDNKYFNHEFISRCLAEAEKLQLQVEIFEEPISPLQLLGLTVLLDTADISISDIQQVETE